MKSACLVMAAAISAACFAGDGYSCERHPWFGESISLGELGILDERELAVDQYAPVVGEKNVAAAESLLASVAGLPIDQVLAYKLTDRSPTKWPPGELFLIRGIRFPTALGKNFVSYFDGKVLVRFSHLGPAGGAAISAPIVVILPKVPTKVFMLCTGAS